MDQDPAGGQGVTIGDDVEIGANSIRLTAARYLSAGRMETRATKIDDQVRDRAQLLHRIALRAIW